MSKAYNSELQAKVERFLKEKNISQANALSFLQIV